MTAGGGMMGTGVGMVGHHQLYPSVGEANPHLALGGQLLPAQTAKLDNRQEEVRISDLPKVEKIKFLIRLLYLKYQFEACLSIIFTI